MIYRCNSLLFKSYMFINHCGLLCVIMFLLKELLVVLDGLKTSMLMGTSNMGNT